MRAQGGEQEAYRWYMRAPHGRTLSIIEKPAKDEDSRKPNTPFGFARVLRADDPPPATDEAWEGMGL